MQIDDTTDQGQATVQLRHVLFGLGGFNRGDVAALQALLARTQEELDEARNLAEQEREQHALQVKSLRGALDESAGWAQRLPPALWELMKLAAGEADREGLDQRLAEAIHEVVGWHLLASVEISRGDSVGEVDQRTEWDTTGRPSSTTTRFGEYAVACVWDPRADVDEDIVGIVESLCVVALFSLAGAAEASMREQRGIVTQLGDGHALARHRALRERLDQHTSELSVEVNEDSAGEHRMLYGQVAWDASFADAGAALEEIAHRHGGAAYQVGALSFRLLIDRDREVQPHAEAEERLGACQLDFDIRPSG